MNVLIIMVIVLNYAKTYLVLSNVYVSLVLNYCRIIKHVQVEFVFDTSFVAFIQNIYLKI